MKKKDQKKEREKTVRDLESADYDENEWEKIKKELEE
jgi:hypothetical protein